jgi:hypothetical protein
MLGNSAAEKEVSQPVSVGDRALENLEFIRGTMERSQMFTNVPGYGGALMGVTALATAFIAQRFDFGPEWMLVWFTEAALALLIGLFAIWQKAKLSESKLVTVPARKFALSFLPPLICGIAVTAGLWRTGNFMLMVPTWLVCYGAAVVCCGAFSVRAVPLMGWIFIALGAVAFGLPFQIGNVMMGLGFGLVHIVFGIYIGRRHGG